MSIQKKIQNIVSLPVIIGIIIALVGIGGGIYFSKKAAQKEQKKVVNLTKKKSSLKSLIFGKGDYTLKYSDKPSSLVELVSDFEPGETWKGQGFLDRRVYFEGDSSIALTSTDHKTSSIYLNKKLDLSKTKHIEFYLNLSDNQALESGTLKLGDDNLDNLYIYALSNLNIGWNFIRIPVNQFLSNKKDNKFDWSKITKVQFEITSRPQNTVVANFDIMTIQNDDSYLKDWNVTKEEMISFGKENEKIYLLGRNNNAFEASLSAVSGVENFDFKLMVMPQKAGRSGILFRGDYRTGLGYYFLIGGDNTNTWSLMKNGKEGWKTIIEGEINNFVFEKNKPYWLLVNAKGNKLTGSLSLNSKDYTEIFSATDEEFKSGGVGIAVLDGTYALFDDFYLKR